MKFDLTSDLHLDFGGVSELYNSSNEGSKVLVLAGDTLEARLLKEKSTLKDQVVEYFKFLNERYERVIWIIGNHCHYQNSFIHTKKNLTDRFRENNLTNFVVLEKETIEVDDTIFFGATMWTTMNNENPVVVQYCEGRMNDYSQIHVAKLAYGEKVYLSPRDTARQCILTKEKIKEFALLKTDKKKVLVTHMAPCLLSVPENFRHDPLHYAYFEELFDILIDSDIKLAVHGHLHSQVDYEIEDLRIVSNPRGYYGDDPTAFDHKFKQIEV